MRVQNEGTGKSSWWMINPDAKPGKAARRRATSMETQKYEKKRGRVKKKVEALRASGGVVHETTSPASSLSEGLDAFPESPLERHSSVGGGFSLSPLTDFRPRTTSNASSCGRLSPPPLETDMHDREAPPLSPGGCGGWENGIHGSSSQPLYHSTSDQSAGGAGDPYTDQQLVELANTMKLGGGGHFGPMNSNCVQSKSSPSASSVQLNGTIGGHSSPPGVPTLAALQPLYNGYSNGGLAAVSTATGGTLSRNGSDPYFKTAGLENNITLSELGSTALLRAVLYYRA